ncbi:unnamed protein product [Sympodiomycopsis kandeliae]
MSVLSESDRKRLEVCLPPGGISLPCEDAHQEDKVDPDLKRKLATFHDLKTSTTPVHFNESLRNNRSFHNPHIYDKLVSFIGIDERLSHNLASLDEGVRGVDKINTLQQEYVARLQREKEEYKRREGYGKIEFIPSKKDGEDGREDKKSKKKKKS